MPPEFAPMLLDPAAVQFANPATLGALATVATLADEELQCAFKVTSCVLPSLKVPVAANCCVVPADTVGDVGVTAMEDRVPVPTVIVVVPLTPEALAVMVTVPPFLAWAIPDERTETILGFDDFQETPLRFVAVLPSLKVPVAVNFSNVPTLIRGFAGVMAIDTR